MTLSRPYALGVDIGGTQVKAASAERLEDGAVRATTICLEASGPAMRAVAGIAGDELVVGAEATELARREPQNCARGFIARVGDSTPYILGNHQITAAQLCAAVVEAVTVHARAERGSEPQRISLVHPPNWRPWRITATLAALAERGLVGIRAISSPIAVAASYGGDGTLPSNIPVAVCDLGRHTMSVTLVQRRADDSLAELGQSQICAYPGATSFTWPAETDGPSDQMLSQLQGLIDRAFVAAGISSPGECAVILAGGLSRMPSIVDYLAQLRAAPVLMQVDPQYAGSIGAAASATTGQPSTALLQLTSREPRWVRSARGTEPVRGAVEPLRFIARPRPITPLAAIHSVRASL
ncbi:hypothetical protein [Cumulibacter soli]|uniref:hypothetical protein n=1 Tax=Cumulibacter soli TaxID=2546344 RepID=UPI001419F6E1|nr:hypothetical protein [Cumulibacter soli]